MNSVENGLKTSLNNYFVDEKATMLGNAIAHNIDMVPPNFQPILINFYDRIMQIKLKVDQLRISYINYAQQHMTDLIEISTDIRNYVIEHFERIKNDNEKLSAIIEAETMAKRFPLYFSNCYGEIEQKILPKTAWPFVDIVDSVINNLNQNINDNNKAYDIVCTLRDLMPQIAGELGAITYKIDEKVSQNHLTHAVQKCIEQNGLYAKHEFEIIRNKLKDATEINSHNTNDAYIINKPIELVQSICETGFTECD